MDWIDVLKESGKVIVDEDHDWGYQLRLVNESEYCGKFLVLTNNKPGSLHYHKVKKETFIILYGVVFVEQYTGEVCEGLFGWRYNIPGDQVTIIPGIKHRMVLCNESNILGEGYHNYTDDYAVILEVSTYDDDNDTYRIEGDKN